MKGLRLILFMIVINALWAPVNLFVELAKRGGFSPGGLEVVRWGGIAAGLWGLLMIPLVRKKVVGKIPKIKHVVIALSAGIILTGPSHLMYYSALGKTTSVEGTIFNATAPIWVGMFAGLFLREHLHRERWISLGLGALGAYIASVGLALPSLATGHFNWDLLYLLGTFLECTASIIVTALARGSSGLVIMAVEATGMSIGGFIWAGVFPGIISIQIPAQGLAAWASVACLILFCGVMAFGSWMVLVETVPLSVMVATIAIQTPLAAVLAAVTIHEKMGWKLVWGTLLIFAALAVLILEKPQPPLKENSGPESGLVGLSGTASEEVPA